MLNKTKDELVILNRTRCLSAGELEIKCFMQYLYIRLLHNNYVLYTFIHALQLCCTVDCRRTKCANHFESTQFMELKRHYVLKDKWILCMRLAAALNSPWAISPSLFQSSVTQFPSGFPSACQSLVPLWEGEVVCVCVGRGCGRHFLQHKHPFAINPARGMCIFAQRGNNLTRTHGGQRRNNDRCSRYARYEFSIRGSPPLKKGKKNWGGRKRRRSRRQAAAVSITQQKNLPGSSAWQISAAPRRGSASVKQEPLLWGT